MMPDFDERLAPASFALMAQSILDVIATSPQDLAALVEATGLPASTVIRVVSVLNQLRILDAMIEGDTLRIRQ